MNRRHFATFYFWVICTTGLLLAHVAAGDELPGFSDSDFSPTVPSEWISMPDSTLHQACGNGPRIETAVKRRLMDIFSWKTFIALNWPTFTTRIANVPGDQISVEASAPNSGDAIKQALDQLHTEGSVEVELLSDGQPQSRVLVTKCDRYGSEQNLLASDPLQRSQRMNGSLWEPEQVLSSSAETSADNCPRWMTWHRAYEVRQGFPPIPPRRCGPPNQSAGPAEALQVTSLATFGDLDNLSASMVPGGIIAPLIDQNGNRVYYDIILNSVAYCNLKSFAPQPLQGMPHSTYTSPLDFQRGQWGNNGYFPGATELKLAWKVLDPEKDDRKHFIWQTASLLTAGDPQKCTTTRPPEGCSWRTEDVGMVGMHILHKTKDHPNWIWSTFEQVDNAPDVAYLGDASGRHFSFFGNCANLKCKLNQPQGELPAELTRTESIGQDTENLNRAVRATLAKRHSVLQYYQLVGTQYEPCGTASPSDISTAEPKVLRNTVIEPFVESETRKSSCIGCHSQAGVPPTRKGPMMSTRGPNSDFSFVGGPLNLLLTNPHSR